MERYNLIKEIGDGTFGTVWKAIYKQTGEVVAIKKMKRKYYSWEECINLREVKSLRRMNHPNIVKLKEVIRENDMLFFVFEYLDCNLYELMKDRQNLFTEGEIRNWCFQVFQSLAYMHERGYFHRDLKPENLLVSKDVIKLADFGLAREINSQPPYTEYVSTRWYRAPEVLLQSYYYSSNVDMWAMGAIMAELFTLRPLFPGANEADEIYKICSVIGSPTMETWAEGMNLAKAMNYQFPKHTGVPLSRIIPSASENAISLITMLCSWDPCNRPTAAEALQHPFFQRCYYVPPSIRSRTAITRMPLSGSVATKAALEQPFTRRYSGPSAASLSNARLPYNSSIPNMNVPSSIPNVNVPYNSSIPNVNVPYNSSIPNVNVPMSTTVMPMPSKVYMANNYEVGSLVKNTKFVEPSPTQAKYIPPGRKSPTSVIHKSWNVGVSETADQLANMRIRGVDELAHMRTGGRGRQSWGPPMRAGWNDAPTYKIQPNNVYSRKVAG